MAATEIAQGSEGAVKRWSEGAKKMPAKMRAIGGGKYKVSTPNATHAKSTTKANAEGQVRLLNAIDHGKRKGAIGGRRR